MKTAKINIPFIDRKIIKKKADQFRRDYWNEEIPVDIEKIIDNKLKIDIVVTAGLRDNFDIDAFITSDWSAIFVDLISFNNERLKNRLRSSLAHEIGHYILHKEIYESFGVETEADYYRHYERLPQDEYNKLEVQAFIFAGYLLVPRDRLELEKKSIMEKVKDTEKFDPEMMREYLAQYLSKKFGISSDAMQFILNFDDRNKQ